MPAFVRYFPRLETRQTRKSMPGTVGKVNHAAGDTNRRRRRREDKEADESALQKERNRQHRRRRLAYYKRCHRQICDDDTTYACNQRTAEDETSASSRHRQSSSTARQSPPPLPAWMTSDGWKESLPVFLLVVSSLDVFSTIMARHQPPTPEQVLELARNAVRERQAMAHKYNQLKGRHVQLTDRYRRLAEHSEQKSLEWQKLWEQQSFSSSHVTMSRSNKTPVATPTTNRAPIVQETVVVDKVAAIMDGAPEGRRANLHSKSRELNSSSGAATKKQLSTSNVVPSWPGNIIEESISRANFKTTGLEDGSEENCPMDDNEVDQQILPPPSKKARRVTVSPNRIRANLPRNQAPTTHEDMNHRVVPDEITSHDARWQQMKEEIPIAEINLQLKQNRTVPTATTTSSAGTLKDQNSMEHERPARGTSLHNAAAGNRTTLRSAPRIADIPTSFHRRHVPNPFSSTNTQMKPVAPLPEDDSQTIIPQPKPGPIGMMAQEVDDGSETIIAPAMRRKTGAWDNSSKNQEGYPPSSSGWISTRPSKAFVEEARQNNMARTIARKKDGEPDRPSTSDRNNPYEAQRTASRPVMPASPDSSLEEEQEQPYAEVVRNKAERQKLKPYSCEECGKFIDAMLAYDTDGVLNREELMCCSRHRHRFPPSETPEGFWELSFHDEILARQKAMDKGSK